VPHRARAAVFTAPGEVEVREIIVPDPAPGEVLVRTEASIISNGTEIWIWGGRFHSPGRSTPYTYPVVPGYQRVGIVEALGDGVTSLRPGQRVAATVSRLEGVPCSFTGSHAELGVTVEGECIPVPDDVAPEDVAGLVLTQVGYNGGTRPPVEAGTSVVVLGDGLVGQWAAQAFMARGAHVVLCGRRDRRLELGLEHSAHEVVDARTTDIEAWVRERYPDGVDIVDEAVGRLANVELAFRLLRHDGHLVFNGYHPEGEHLMSIQWMHDKEITCWGLAGWTAPRMLATLGWIREGKLNVREIVTHEFPGTEADRAYRMIRDRSDDFLGVLLRWGNR